MKTLDLNKIDLKIIDRIACRAWISYEGEGGDYVPRDIGLRWRIFEYNAELYITGPIKEKILIECINAELGTHI